MMNLGTLLCNWFRKRRIDKVRDSLTHEERCVVWRDFMGAHRGKDSSDQDWDYVFLTWWDARNQPDDLRMIHEYITSRFSSGS